MIKWLKDLFHRHNFKYVETEIFDPQITHGNIRIGCVIKHYKCKCGERSYSIKQCSLF